ncbi:fumarylacetoacetate (FAA) hydrolase family protein [Paraburkholderia xenovorans LB400]|uniref:Fumarylacetoacetate (FAA) hydrolase n=1 Tax=Paraburkholderia xenovorans (strain LB400) TaxID=266265 RepID=Q13H90_PARXL|nr:fumarylacetoacetate hydrolase family protein [Paraburkholderia xenovorans]ABE36549.1 Putative fumarylacetoacetate (FAA) hydrolase [Paraburkholderia xenovorans LB400]AIP34626.1 fumarylacetoacetate (FAA) hydrolase family protein [Paraburkholderia xenovorans LB400]
MKLLRCENGDVSFWGVLENSGSTVRPISGRFAEWAPALTRSLDMETLVFSGEAVPLERIRLLPPIERTSKVVVAGANYMKHLTDFGLERPKQPFAFLKSYGALIGANDPIQYPPLTHELDHEVELVAVVGADRVDPQCPMAAVLGFTVGNDVSARDLQRSGPAGIGMDLFSAKSLDQTTGVGPWIVTRDEFPTELPDLRLTLRVNGEIRQDSFTSRMIWSVPELLHFINARCRFECGDILFTGTPERTGEGHISYLNPGDVVEAEIEGIGKIRNVVNG